MRIINISKEEFLNLLLNRDSFSGGVYCKLVLNNDKLYKIYYKDFIDAYLTKNIEKLDETANYRFISTYKAVKSGVDQKRIDRYQIKSYTSVDDVLKMANGEEVKQSSDEEVNKQGVPVLNYHFFYDPNEDSCDESICLEVSKFREHLEYLKNNNFKTLTIEEFRKWMYGEIEVPSKSVLITIDDGAKGTG